MTHLLAIVRLGILCGLLLAFFLFVAVTTVWCRWVLPSQTLSVPYRWQWWARRVVALLGLRVNVHGVPPPAPCLFVANHLSYLDIVVLAAQMDAVFVAKAEVARWPVLGLLGRAVGTVFIDRARKRDLPRVIAAMIEVLRRGQRVVFFPEGTSSAGGTVLPFHSPLFEAAVRTGVPVRYASLTYRTICDTPPASRAVCWWGDMTFARHLYGLLRLSGVQVTLSFGRDTVAADNRKRFAVQARAAVLRLFSPVGSNADRPREHPAWPARLQGGLPAEREPDALHQVFCSPGESLPHPFALSLRRQREAAHSRNNGALSVTSQGRPISILPTCP
ncbi:MAG: 1-acyl-sn-glycerol-3-phosphate acyltransferase [Candidatus Binatia bacterium]|nr:1-acyl-sn-glycerol-3-phosphate acyltransferase [Candidatus Binatia bacterium]